MKLQASLLSCRALRTELSRRRGSFAAVLGLATFAQGVGIPVALLTRTLVDDAFGGSNAQSGMAWTHMALLLALVGFQGLFTWFHVVRGERLALSIIADLRIRLVARLQTLALEYFDRRPIGALLVRFVGDATALQTWIAKTLVSVPADGLTLLGVGIALFVIHPAYALAAMVPLVVLVPVLVFMNPRARALTHLGRKEQTAFSSEIGGILERLGPIQAAQAEEAYRKRVHVQMESARDALSERAHLDAWSRAVPLAGGTLGACLVAGAGVALHPQGSTTAGEIVAALWLALLLKGPLNRLARGNVIHQRALVSIARIEGMLARDDPESVGSLPYDGSALRIRLSGLGYRNAQRQWLLQDLDATFQGPGLFVLTGDARRARLVFELILRLRQTQRGKVALDGVRATRLRLADVRSRVGWVDRDRAIIPCTLVARDEAELEAGWKETEPIAPACSLSDAIDAAKLGTLSAALELRMAVACALHGDRPVLLFEDPSCGLDRSATNRLTLWLEEQSQRRLLLVSTQESRLLNRAHRVLRLRSGSPEVSVPRRPLGQEDDQRPEALAPEKGNES